MKKTTAQLRASRKYNEKNKELINKKSLIYSRENPEKVNENKQKYREKNRERLRQKGREYYQKNKEKIAAKAKERYLKSKAEREVNEKMFGNRKKITENKPTVEEKPDLVIPKQPETVGMRGFTPDPAPVSTPVSEPEPLAAPVKSPDAQIMEAGPMKVKQESIPQVQEQYQIMSAELLQDGLFRYVIVTNKNLGEVGGVYEA